MDKQKAKRVLRDIYIKLFWEWAEEFSRDYIDYLDEKEQKIACEAEKILYHPNDEEFCICGSHVETIL